MVSGQLSALLVDWTTAVTELDIQTVQLLLEKEPELLWTPIPHTINDDHLQRELTELDRLGTTFQPMSSIQFMCLFYQQDLDKEQDSSRIKVISYLIEVWYTRYIAYTRAMRLLRVSIFIVIS
jgi:hypothetical protein